MPTDNSTADDNLQECKPSSKGVIACGPCAPSDYGFNPIRLPNLQDIIDQDNDTSHQPMKLRQRDE